MTHKPSRTGSRYEWLPRFLQGNLGAVETPHGTMSKPLVIAPGVMLWREHLDRTAQKTLLDDVMRRVEQAPFYRPQMPGSGAAFSVEETNFGPLGWLSDKTGYRYTPTHPVNGKNWPPIPGHGASRTWNETTAYRAPPECYLVNLYREGARMGLHQDRDETAAEDAGAVSVAG